MTDELPVRILRELTKTSAGASARFGAGQECTAEFLTLLLDGLCAATRDEALAQLFTHKYQQSVYCSRCEQVVSATTSTDNMFRLYENPGLCNAGAARFSEGLVRYSSAVDDYDCPRCREKARAVVLHKLKRVPEVLICVTDLLQQRLGVGAARGTNSCRLPPFVEIPAAGGSATSAPAGTSPAGHPGFHHYSLVAGAKHVGGASGGHYWAECQRRVGARDGTPRVKLVRLNSSTVEAVPSQVITPDNLYIGVYHYRGHVDSRTPTR